MKRLMLFAVLGLAGCGDVEAPGAREDDAGSGGAAQTGDAGTGGGTAGGPGSGGALGTGGSSVDAGGSGGAAQPGTGGAGSGGADGSGGVQGSGGAIAGTGGSTAETPACADPNGWTIGGLNPCYVKDAGGVSHFAKKNGLLCSTNCQSTRPGGAAGNYIGPPQHPECTFDTDSICVSACGECQ